MRKYLQISMPILLFVGFLLAGNWSFTKITWSTGSVTSSTILESTADTSDIFDLTRRGKGGRDFPQEVSFLMRTVEGALSDSTDITFSLELSNDQVVWYDFGTLKRITDTGTNAETFTDSKTLVISSSVNPLASVTMVYDSTLNEVIIAEPYVDGLIDSVAHITSTTYAYNFGFLPQYRYGRILATGQAMIGDTITVEVDMSRVWK